MVSRPSFLVCANAGLKNKDGPCIFSLSAKLGAIPAKPARRQKAGDSFVFFAEC